MKDTNHIPVIPQVDPHGRVGLCGAVVNENRSNPQWVCLDYDRFVHYDLTLDETSCEACVLLHAMEPKETPNE